MPDLLDYLTDCPQYLNNPDSGLLGDGPVAALTADHADLLLGVPVYLQHARQSVRDGAFAGRRGPAESGCDQWFVLIPALDNMPPTALPTEVAVSAGVVEPAYYSAQIGSQDTAQERRATRARIDASKVESLAQDRAYWARQPGFLDYLAQEARQVGAGLGGLSTGLLWALGAVVLLGLFFRAKG